jgi:pyroglutamyl-peptidase
MTKPKIIVTGYGPFGSYAFNPSSEVVSRLKDIPEIRDCVELSTEILSVDYEDALAFAVKAGEYEPDFIIHVGVHPTNCCVKLEQQSFSHGYCGVDVNGKVPLLNRCQLAKHEDQSTLQSVLDCDALADQVSSGFKRLAVLRSDNPGRYLCAYVYYCSLLLQSGRALFVHIPEFDEIATPEAILEILCRIIKRIAEQLCSNVLKIDFQMGKRRREELSNGPINGFHHDNDVDSGESSSLFDTPLAKRLKRDSTANTPAIASVHNDDTGDSYEYWLIRKPKTCSQQMLKQLKIPRKAKPQSSTLEVQEKDEQCRRLSCEVQKPLKQMLYLCTSGAESAKQLRSLRPAGAIKGVLLLSDAQELSADFPLFPDDDFLGTADDNTQIPFKIRSIRKKPKLRLERLKERLKAFGAVHSSSSSSKSKKKRKRVKKESFEDT